MKKLLSVILTTAIVCTILASSVFAATSDCEVIYCNYGNVYETANLEKPIDIMEIGKVINAYYISENNERVAFISPADRKLYARDEKSDEPKYIVLLDNCASASVSDKFIVAKMYDGTVVAKCGLYDSWTVISDQGVAFASEDKIFLRIGNEVFVKEDINGSWVSLFVDSTTPRTDMEIGGGFTVETDVRVFDNYIYLTTKSGDVYEKYGIYGAWTLLDGNCHYAIRENDIVYTYRYSGDLVAIPEKDKWITIIDSIKRFVIEDDRILALNENELYYKEGLYGNWITLAENSGLGWATMCDDTFAVTIDGTLHTKDGVFAPWTKVKSEYVYNFEIFKK